MEGGRLLPRGAHARMFWIKSAQSSQDVARSAAPAQKVLAGDMII